MGRSCSSRELHTWKAHSAPLSMIRTSSEMIPNNHAASSNCSVLSGDEAWWKYLWHESSFVYLALWFKDQAPAYSFDILCVVWWRLWFLRNRFFHSDVTRQTGDVVNWAASFLPDFHVANSFIKLLLAQEMLLSSRLQLVYSRSIQMLILTKQCIIREFGLSLEIHLIKVVSWVLVVCLMLFLVNTDCKRVLSHEEIIPQATICCREHPELGHCEKGKDDAPNGKCPNFCSQECRGGECKNRNGKWQCHCYC
ncbi:hypothetical protein JRO89_XS09G0207900 [Xanthoceras sorbifolium]|uniref:Uncharacterized protein n=1 Tax=Xanthoceras sorbifolium TaxID=99658 RepID=A0ABQ8HM67_9ROSI|nr:hypothetical protein JRO89_XS09G0207900 [Xanthoceras sorbifolium]